MPDHDPAPAIIAAGAALVGLGPVIAAIFYFAGLTAGLITLLILVLVAVGLYVGVIGRHL